MNHDLERSVRLLEAALSTPPRGPFATSASRRRPAAAPLNLSITLAPDELSRLLDADRSLHNDTAAATAAHAAPWAGALASLHAELAGILQQAPGGADALETAARLATCCADALLVVERLRAARDGAGERWLAAERDNWRLLYVLYQDRLRPAAACGAYCGASEKLCAEGLFRGEPLVREAQLVVDWLERGALERDDAAVGRPEPTYGWEHTLHQLLAPGSIAIGSSVPVVASVHPDAALHEGRALHHLDQENERMLCRRVFCEIRCGGLERAQELCYGSGHPWRAAILEGWKLYHNPNEGEAGEMDVEGDGEVYRDVEGNRNRDLWKVVAFDYCAKKNLNLYERAAIATLCGDLPNILPICNTWEDYLWAYMKTMVDIRVESEIRDNIIRKYEPLPDSYWDQKMSLDEVFSTLESTKKPTIRAESQEIDHIIQKHIILNEIKTLSELLTDWASDETHPTHTIRFFAHLVIFFDNVDQCFNHQNCEFIIEEYIKRLGQMNETELVAFYASKLPRAKQIAIYANHLEKIYETDDRKAALDYGEQFGLDVLAVTQRIVETIRTRPSALERSDLLQAKLTEPDRVKISALEWLTFYEEQLAEAVVQANALVFAFLTLGKLEAAQLALEKVPADAVGRLAASDELGQAVREHLGYRAYLEAHEAFNEWFREEGGRPRRPEAPAAGAAFTERVAFEHRVAQFEEEAERWRMRTLHAREAARTRLYNVLLYPEGWLVGGRDADYLRSVCLPEVVMLLFSVLSESGLYGEAVQLGDLIASERYKIYKVYGTEKLGEILEKICEISVCLLNMKKDPWGNSDCS